jgi:hypothetical protein
LLRVIHGKYVLNLASLWGFSHFVPLLMCWHPIGIKTTPISGTPGGQPKVTPRKSLLALRRAAVQPTRS